MPSVPNAAYASLAPDWACEVLSPSTALLDRARKLAIYAREGVTHAWLVDPLLRSLEVLQFEGGRWAPLATHAGNDAVRAEPFVEVEIELAQCWADTADPGAEAAGLQASAVHETGGRKPPGCDDLNRRTEVLSAPRGVLRHA